MVIYDTENNYDNRIKGMLYLSLMDVDYLVSKYSMNKLQELISKDYADLFEEEIALLKMEDKLSYQYYSAISLGIENEEDLVLLELLAKEVKLGNIFTKKHLKSLSSEEIEQGIQEINVKNDLFDSLSLEELYKLRSYQMSKYITENINEAKKYLQIMERCCTGDYVIGEKGSYKNAQKEYKRILFNMEAIGLSDDICESNYFSRSSKRKLYKNI